jgi:hypothetical protein
MTTSDLKRDQAHQKRGTTGSNPRNASLATILLAHNDRPSGRAAAHMAWAGGGRGALAALQPSVAA